MTSYEVIDVNPYSIAALQGRTNETFAARFGRQGGGTTGRIGVGDRLSVVIWEAASGGLFSGETGSIAGSGSKSATIPDQTVNSAGKISIPYAGQIQAAGRTPDEVRADIEAALAGKAIEPQALVNVTSSVFNTVTVTGEVVGGGRIPLSPNGDRLLDVIATAGGVKAPAHETFVSLTRRTATARVPLQRIIDDPSENIYLAAGDVLSLTRIPQTFTAFGALGQSAEVPFDAEGLTLNEALAKVGGLVDERSDPAGVFIYRVEQRPVVQRLVPQSQVVNAYAGDVPVIYRINLRDPSGLFMAKSFEVFDGDLVYVAPAGLNETRKFLQLVTTVTQPAMTGLTVYRAVGN